MKLCLVGKVPSTTPYFKSVYNCRSLYTKHLVRISNGTHGAFIPSSFGDPARFGLNFNDTHVIVDIAGLWFARELVDQLMEKDDLQDPPVLLECARASGVDCETRKCVKRYIGRGECVCEDAFVRGSKHDRCPSIGTFVIGVINLPLNCR